MAATLLQGCDYLPMPSRIDRVVHDVDGFDLVLDDSATTVSRGNFDIGYAIKANYAYFTYGEDLYCSAGSGSALIRSFGQSPARYVVRETIRYADKQGSNMRSRLQVLDKTAGEELARRDLVAHAVEDGTGCTSDHAMRFVRKVLVPLLSSSHGGLWGIYPTTQATVEFTPTIDAVAYRFADRFMACPRDFQIVLGDGAWELGAVNPVVSLSPHTPAEIRCLR